MEKSCQKYKIHRRYASYRSISIKVGYSKAVNWFGTKAKILFSSLDALYLRYLHKIEHIFFAFSSFDRKNIANLKLKIFVHLESMIRLVIRLRLIYLSSLNYWLLECGLKHNGILFYFDGIGFSSTHFNAWCHLVGILKTKKKYQ